MVAAGDHDNRLLVGVVGEGVGVAVNPLEVEVGGLGADVQCESHHFSFRVFGVFRD